MFKEPGRETGIHNVVQIESAASTLELCKQRRQRSSNISMGLIGSFIVRISCQLVPNGWGGLGNYLKVGFSVFECTIILLIYFLNCRKALFTSSLKIQS